jgi:hypothetical protein
MMKFVGGSNPTVSSLVDPVSELKSCLRGELPGGCLRLLRSDRPNTAAHGTAPHAYRQKTTSESDEVDPRGTSIRKIHYKFNLRQTKVLERVIRFLSNPPTDTGSSLYYISLKWSLSRSVLFCPV